MFLNDRVFKYVSCLFYFAGERADPCAELRPGAEGSALGAARLSSTSSRAPVRRAPGTHGGSHGHRRPRRPARMLLLPPLIRQLPLPRESERWSSEVETEDVYV